MLLESANPLDLLRSCSIAYVILSKLCQRWFRLVKDSVDNRSRGDGVCNDIGDSRGGGTVSEDVPNSEC